jgi:DNA polymerase III subunit gamma/tau
MSTYEPLHHKYRPQTLADLVGQEAIATTLVNALKTERIAPAYLLTGARGTGKTSTARIMAKSLNCLRFDAPTPTPCGECSMCREITTGRSLDITEIDAASNTGVDNIREIIERAQFAPVQARYKVYAIDECHMLSIAAFNALLKTLEEPPDRVVFILATTDPQRVLPTIISRCQRFDFRRIPLNDIVLHLGKIAQNENIKINSEALLLVAQISQGGLRDAESLLDQLSLLEDGITPEAVWDLVGSVPERDLLSLLEAIASDSPTQIIEIVRRIMDRGREPLIVLQSLAGSYRDLLIAKTASDRHDLVSLTASSWEQLMRIAQGLSLPSILEGQKYLRSAEVQIKNSTQPRLWLEVTLMSLLPSAIAPATQTQAPANLQVNFQAVKPQAPPQSQTSPSVTATQTQSTPLASPSSDPSTQTPSTETVAKLVEPDRLENPPLVSQEFVEPELPIIPTEIPSVPTPSVSIVDSDREPEMPAQSSAVDLDSAWEKVLAHLEPISRVAKSVLAQQGKLLEVNQAIVKIGITRNNIRHVKPKMNEVEQCCRKVFGKSVKIEIEALESLSAADVARNSSELSAAFHATPTKPPTVNELKPAETLRHEPVFPNPAPKQVATNPVPTPLPDPSQVRNQAGNQAATNSTENQFPAIARNVYMSPSEEDVAIRRIAEIFNGQIISIEDEEEVVEE